MLTRAVELGFFCPLGVVASPKAKSFRDLVINIADLQGCDRRVEFLRWPRTVFDGTVSESSSHLDDRLTRYTLLVDFHPSEIFCAKCDHPIRFV
jgi:hypothetical protein